MADIERLPSQSEWTRLSPQPTTLRGGDQGLHELDINHAPDSLRTKLLDFKYDTDSFRVKKINWD